MFNIIVCQKCDISIGSDSISIYVACCKGGGISAAMFFMLFLLLLLLYGARAAPISVVKTTHSDYRTVIHY
jgi:hypothetical protein